MGTSGLKTLATASKASLSESMSPVPETEDVETTMVEYP